MNTHELGLILNPPVVIYIVTVGDRKHTLRNWTEVSQLCAKSFVSDPEKTIEIKHVRNDFAGVYTGPGSSEHACAFCDDSSGGCIECY